MVDVDLVDYHGDCTDGQDAQSGAPGEMASQERARDGTEDHRSRAATWVEPGHDVSPARRTGAVDRRHRALAIERLDWGDAQYWMRLQASYDPAQERRKQAA